ncbi:MAG TPA: hypothetical protein PK767_10825, partial [Clostridiales bacterium]|nr:hypothetical protein [Clostridiales bacterium]
IPQISDFADYVKAEYQGFRRIILDLRSSGTDADKLAEFLDRNKVSAAVLSEEQASDTQLVEILESRKIAVLK